MSGLGWTYSLKWYGVKDITCVVVILDFQKVIKSIHPKEVLRDS